MSIFEQKTFTGFTVDATRFSVVTVCLNPACDWRILTPSRVIAWQVAREHEQAVHPGSHHAAEALAQLQKRQARFGTSDPAP